MATGKVKNLVQDKGYGFIAAPDGGNFFFHASGCAEGLFDTLTIGDEVSFSTEDGKADSSGKKKGPRAIGVRRA